MAKSLSRILQIPLMFAPSFIKIWVYRRLFGWQIGDGVKIGITYLSADHIHLGNRVRIGHLNVIRNLRCFEMGDESFMLNMNTFSGSSYQGWPGKYVMGKRSKIMSHHYFDASGTISIGDDCTIGGRDTQFWSHSLKKSNGLNSLVPLEVEVGADVYIGARCTLVASKVADGCFVGAGAVVLGDRHATERDCLLAGNPAIVKKRNLSHSV